MDEKTTESLWKILQHYGPRHQIAKAIEELSELQTELAKSLNGDGSPGDLLSECADVFVMLIEVMAIYDIDMERFNEEVEFKVFRQISRIQIEKQINKNKEE